METPTQKPKLFVFASGTATNGGSGFGNLVRCARGGILDVNIVGVASNHENGGVRKRADKYAIPFVHLAGPWDASCYQQIARDSRADFFALSGWLKRVVRLDPRFTFNIHPGPLPEFGGAGMYGHHVHEAVMAAFHRREAACREVVCSAVTMHFVTSEYDQGPVFFEKEVKIWTHDTPDTLGRRVNEFEHCYQPIITNLVVHREIRWDGVSPSSLKLPFGYKIHRLQGE